MRTKPVSIEKRARVVALRTANPDLPMEVIAIRIGISEATARKIFKDATQKATFERQPEQAG
jgi:hypothetical protein